MGARIIYAPIVHGSMPFALAVREVFFRERPDCVAVELPHALAAYVERAIGRLPLLSVLRRDSGGGDADFLLIEPCDGIVEALRLAREHALPSHLVDRDGEGYADHQDRIPDPHAIAAIGYQAYVDRVATALGRERASADDQLREATMAYRLSRLAERYQRVLFVCGLAHVQGVRRRLAEPIAHPLGRRRPTGVQVFQLDEASSREVLSEPGWVQSLYEAWREQFTGAVPPRALTDRYRVTRDLVVLARDRMHREDGERVGARELRILLQFARNQALARGGLAPNLFEVTVAARGVASDDFAWHVWDMGVHYPHQTATPDLPAYRLTLEELHRGSKQVWFRRRMKTRRHALRLVRGRPSEPVSGAWGQGLDSPFLCSYPPEDLRLEAYGTHLRKRASGLVSEARARVSPLSSGMRDGIDFRETIRNLLHDGRIFVREEDIGKGEIGAVCFIFDPDDPTDRYRFTLTWQGEHEEESDMALYATPPEEHPVGPRIGRAEYGGFLLTYPPGRMFHVFEDPYFDHAQTRAERLLYAAIDYGADRSILYVAPRPPRAKVRQFARRAGKRVIFLPIGQLSPATVRKIRVFHVLDGREAREHASDYIGE